MRLLFSLTLTVFCASLWAQKAPNYFHAIAPEAVVLPEAAQREIEPSKYAAFTLDYQSMVNHLNNAPKEYSAEAKKQAWLVRLPMADGYMEDFVVLKTSTMAPALEAQHPEILTLSGTSIDHPGMQLRITVSPYWGFRAMILRADKGIERIQPMALGQNQFYMAYSPEDVARNPAYPKLGTDLKAPPIDLSSLQEVSTPRYTPGEPTPENGDPLRGPVVLKVYRFACACTGEFSQDNGGTKDAVFAKVTQTTAELNAIYERDINIRLELIPESYDIIFLDPATDPYTGTDVGGWMSQNPGIMYNVLGTDSKYDVGHVFARYLGGSAIGVAGGQCCTQLKGRGCSAWYGPPYGDEFFAIVGQEIGHMWRSGHTFNQCFEGAQFDYDSACEPGSGSTIMSYNGACGTNNISNTNTALYYHACSIAEIRNFVEHQEGNTCGSNLTTPNNDPIPSTTYPETQFIPIGTPFELTGTAVDPDGDTQLTYTWDEMDLGPTTALGTPVGNSPAFRWFLPTSTPTRTFPRIQTIISNINNITEVLPTYNRDYNFVFVVRDNKPNGGGVGMDTISMVSTTSAGPFQVTYPSVSAISWKVGEYQTVTWNVANTNNALVNCQKVNIRLSLDGGLTYPITLASGVPNIGRACVEVPNNLSTMARIRVDAADHIFFDISNSNFKIEQASAANFSLCAETMHELACLPTNFSTQISTAAIAGFSSPITLTATGMPNGVTAIFEPNPVAPGASSTLTVTFPPSIPETVFDMTVEGSVGAVTAASLITLSVINSDFTSILPTAPVNGAVGVNTQPLLQWSKATDADAYEIELATNPSFEAGSIVASNLNTTLGSFQVTIPLTEGGVYFWRVRGKNDCGFGPWSTTQIFVVSVLSCAQLQANDLPKNISANGTPTVESKITLLAGGQVSDVNITILQGYHEYFKDLEAHLISPTGTDVLLWKDRCGSYNGNFNMGFDDGAGAVFSCPPPSNNADSKPNGLFSTFNGENAAGVWTLRLKDNNLSGGGSLSNFEIQICSNEATNPPVVTVNNSLQLPSGTNSVIGNDLLKSDDANNTADQLTYTLITVPQNGLLQLNGNNLVVGSQFTQAEVDNGALRYFDYGLNLGADSFQFIVADGEGGMDADVFTISPLVGTKELLQGLSFELSPNPADDVLQLSLNESLPADALISIFNTAGQRVRSWTLAAGAKRLTLQINDLSQGVYAVSIENEAVKGVRKVVIR